MRRYFLFLSLCMLAATLLLTPADAHAQTGRLCFNVPGITHCIEGRFREYWEQSGGLAVFGYPTTSARLERSRDTGQVYLTQWFERNSFELHPENAAPYDVLLGRLADYRLFQLNRMWRDEPTASGSQAGCAWFAETQHNVCDQAQGQGFKSYLLTHGLEFDGRSGVSPQESLALIGLPLTEARMETNAAGDSVLTQWFERARLEWHPNKPAPYKVLLGLLGTELRTHVPALKTSCEQTVTEELRRHYEQARGLNDVAYRQALGCPQYAVRDLPASVQSFEGGTMIWHASMSPRGNTSGTILVIFNDTPQRFISYQDQWREGDPETGGEVAPAGTFTPRRGFGKVWREQLGVRSALSWATEPEQAQQAVFQVFDYGWMIWLQGRDLVYVFSYDTGEVTAQSRLR